ncbi:hypothetical protein DAPPUDRAFT_239618 [Daphnia pulex]|uniref:Uncharacterized protein n=1 Tax=Daphnia pulex TaxID=6669 RepID=E9G9P5_DAPPU|nr:hypothetical protein DAPPUDRAFT_239618 [Daphnia pulex]|eukprot:EFX83605.1 hypothetical protein DAPPUDRAFT_239618 [Daphnia pulex]
MPDQSIIEIEEIRRGLLHIFSLQTYRHWHSAAFSNKESLNPNHNLEHLSTSAEF